MLTGTRPFAGEDVSEVAASVSGEGTGLVAAPFRSFACARHRHQALSAEESETTNRRHAGRSARARRRVRRASAVWRRQFPQPMVCSNLALVIAPAVVATAAVTGRGSWILLRSDSPRSVTRLQMPTPAGQTFFFNGRPIVAISPSGRQVAFQAGLGLWLRSLDELEAKSIPGAERR